MKWREALYEDLFLMEPLQLSQCDQDLRDGVPDTQEVREKLWRFARSWTDDDSRVLAIIGVAVPWKGVGQAWALISQEALKHPVALTLGARRWIAWVIDQECLWRVQADVERDHAAGRRWLEFMGFEYEGTLRAYGPSAADHELWARLEERWLPPLR
jgi:hypothetical protein